MINKVLIIIRGKGQARETINSSLNKFFLLMVSALC